MSSVIALLDLFIGFKMESQNSWTELSTVVAQPSMKLFSKLDSAKEKTTKIILRTNGIVFFDNGVMFLQLFLQCDTISSNQESLYFFLIWKNTGIAVKVVQQNATYFKIHWLVCSKNSSNNRCQKGLAKKWEN